MGTRTLKIVQWNAKSIRLKLPELPHKSINYDIFLLSETWLKPEDSFFVRGFDVVRRDRVLRSDGGVAILITNTLRYRVVHNLRDCNDRLEVCAAERALRDGGMLLGSCYRPPGESGISSLEWSSFFSQFNGRFLIGGQRTPLVLGGLS